MTKKTYDGYTSFQYLEPGVDYKPFKLAQEVARVEPYVYPVSAEQERRVQRLMGGRHRHRGVRRGPTAAI